MPEKDRIMSDFRTLMGQDSQSICKGMEASPTIRMAYTLLFEEEHEDAATRFQRILADDPDNSDALAGLAICRADQTGRYITPTKLAKKAVKMNPKSPSGYFALAYLHLKRSRLEEGYKFLMKAKRLAPSDPRVAANLELYDRERPPVIADLSRLHPLNQFLGEARSFLRTTSHRAMALVLVVEGLFLTGRLIS